MRELEGKTGQMEMLVNKAEGVVHEARVSLDAEVKGSWKTEFKNEMRDKIINVNTIKNVVNGRNQ